ncbi:MAG: DUF3179 domain-containing protein [Alphaproteobacteria bacterium]
MARLLPRKRFTSGFAVALAVAATLFAAAAAVADPAAGRFDGGPNGEWSRTDFSRHTIDLADIVSGGPSKDGIPPIDAPVFESQARAAERLRPEAPVISLSVGGEAKAYPLSVLVWHEIVNDVIGGVPVAVTYCPLCNSSIAFDRRVDGRTLDFGTTGKLLKSNLLMWDRQTESWWSQYMGDAVVGEMAGKKLAVVPCRLESFERFRQRRPDGVVLRPTHMKLRAYGRNPYVRYDSAPWPFLYRGMAPEGIAPMARVVAIGGEAWSLDLLRRRGMLKAGGVMLSWTPGQASALDAPTIADGRDVGNVVAERMGPGGPEDVAYVVAFAFAFHGFQPEGTIHVACEAGDAPTKPVVCG